MSFDLIRNDEDFQFEKERGTIGTTRFRQKGKLEQQGTHNVIIKWPDCEYRSAYFVFISFRFELSINGAKKKNTSSRTLVPSIKEMSRQKCCTLVSCLLNSSNRTFRKVRVFPFYFFLNSIEIDSIAIMTQQQVSIIPSFSYPRIGGVFANN